MMDRFSPYKMLTTQLESGQPRHLQIDLTTRCNYDCTFCFFKQGSSLPRHDIDFASLIRVLNQFHGVVTFIGGGEPLMYPNAPEVFEFCHSCQIPFGVVTNLSVMNQKIEEQIIHADWVRVSFNAASTVTFQKVNRPRNEFVVGEVLDHIRKLAGKVEVGVSYLVTADNYQEIRQATELAKNLGCAYIQFKPEHTFRKFLDSDTISSITTELDESKLFWPEGVQDQMSRLWDLKSANRDWHGCCAMPKYVLQVGADGFVYPCCIHKYKEQYRMGSILDPEFQLQDLYESAMLPESTKVLSSLTNTSCPPCFFDTQNNILQYLDQPRTCHDRYV